MTVPKPDQSARSQRLRFTWTQTMDVDVDPQEAASLLDSNDMLDVSDAATRYRRQAHHDYEFIEYDVAVEAVEDDLLPMWGYKALEGGTGQEGYLWSARHFIIQARNELSSGRYREGHCPDLDAVNRDLAVIEDRLREMAWAVDHPELIDGTPT